MTKIDSVNDAFQKMERGIENLSRDLHDLEGNQAAERYFELTKRSKHNRPTAEELAESRAIFRRHKKVILAAIEERLATSDRSELARNADPDADELAVDPNDQEIFDTWQDFRTYAQGKPDATVNEINTTARRYFIQNAEAINRVIAINRAH